MTTTANARYDRVLDRVTPVLLADGWELEGGIFILPGDIEDSSITIWDDLVVLAECELSHPAARKAIMTIWAALDAEVETECDEWVDCEKCSGYGEYFPADELITCPNCNGYGRVRVGGSDEDDLGLIPDMDAEGEG